MKGIKSSAFSVAALMILSACGGGNSTSDFNESTAVASRLVHNSENLAPSINGAPTLSVSENSAYQFTPAASDPENDPLTFVIVNQPSWLQFSASSGVLSGTPSASDIGVFENITISVTDGENTASIVPFTITVEAPLPALQITGTPSPVAQEDSAYSFTPVANYISGTLLFSIINKPSWLTFDPDNGNLYGIPGEADIGTYSNIQISANDDNNTVTLESFSLTVESTSATATLSWVAPATRTDGSAISLSELRGFKIYTGTEEDSLSLLIDIEDPTINEYIVSNLSPATHFFAITVYDQLMIESGFSAIASKTIN